ncbi:MAG: DoxX family protein [bacterium]|nr:DoxX family protein [bacterium]
MDIVFFVGRLVLGLFFTMKGVNHFQNKDGLIAYSKSKNLPAPGASVIIAGIIMLLGGLSLIFGVYVEIALWALAILMVVIGFMMHKFWAETDPGAKSNEKISFMHNMAHAGALLMLLQLADATLPYALNIF